MGYQEDIYNKITNKIINLLESGNTKFIYSWVTLGLPINYKTKTAYRGINAFWLSIITQEKGFKYPYFLTYKQVKELKGFVKKGEKSSLIMFFKPQTYKTTDKETGKEILKSFPVLKYYRVFNVEQTNLKVIPQIKETLKESDLIKECENIIKGYKNKPLIKYAGDNAFYNPKEDFINIPQKEQFKSLEGFYSVIFHELSHSTGHKSRLNRAGIVESAGFGSGIYSKEEIIAELSSCFLCAFAGIEYKTLSNSSAYIQNWLKNLKEDNKFIFKVLGKAQKSADFITGTEYKEVVKSGGVD